MEQNDRSEFLKLLKDNAAPPKDELNVKKVPRYPDKNSWANRATDLKGKCVVFSGALSSMTRNDAAKHLMKLGGNLGLAITKNVDYIVTPNNANFTAKTDKAKKLGIVFIEENVWLDILKYHGIKV